MKNIRSHQSPCMIDLPHKKKFPKTIVPSTRPIQLKSIIINLDSIVIIQMVSYCYKGSHKDKGYWNNKHMDTYSYFSTNSVSFNLIWSGMVWDDMVWPDFVRLVSIMLCGGGWWVCKSVFVSSMHGKRLKML